MITIDDGAFIGVSVVVIAHFKGAHRGERIGKQAYIGPGELILPDVKIGDCAVVTAWSAVSRSVSAMKLAQGSPAKVIL